MKKALDLYKNIPPKYKKFILLSALGILAVASKSGVLPWDISTPPRMG